MTIGSFIEIVEAFIALAGDGPGHLHSTVLPDGTYREGGISDVSDAGIEFWDGGPLAPAEPTVFAEADLDLDQFYVAFRGDRMARRALWSRINQEWIVSPKDPIPIAAMGTHPKVRIIQWRDSPDL